MGAVRGAQGQRWTRSPGQAASAGEFEGLLVAPDLFGDILDLAIQPRPGRLLPASYRSVHHTANEAGECGCGVSELAGVVDLIIAKSKLGCSHLAVYKVSAPPRVSGCALFDGQRSDNFMV